MPDDSNENVEPQFSHDTHHGEQTEPPSSEETVRALAESSVAEGPRPSDRLRIGSLRNPPTERPKAKPAVEHEAEGEAVAKVSVVRAPKSYPPPNIRSKLSLNWLLRSAENR
jgi:hypothetical protein